MGFWERLTGIGSASETEPRILIHPFFEAFAEVERGHMTRAQVISGFGIQPSEEADLDSLSAKLMPWPEAYSMGGFVSLPDVGATYDGSAAAKGLGFTAVDITGITRVVCRVRYNKVGTGTLSWQLWNESDGQQVGVFDDAGAAGDNRQGDIDVTPAQPLVGGIKMLRVRVKSTVATDDPAYYGACIFVRRLARITPEDLHGLLLLAECRIAPYDSIAAIKTRLGV